MDPSTKIDVEYELDTEGDNADDLTFQDFPHDADDSKTHKFTNFPHSAVDSDDETEEDGAKLLKDDKGQKGSSSFWTFAYYQQFFDVETRQVGARIIGSMLPKPGSNYLIKEIRPKPDLYGPFWICTTLVFTTAIAGNLANYFSVGGKDYHWRYDFHKVTFAATAIFSYWWFIPLILFGLFWWRGSKDKFTFLEIICLYGYSLAIYIPISILWAIQVSWLQWTLVMVGAALSGSVLLMNFWPVVSEDNKKIAMGIMAFIFIMHAALAVGFVLYFFYVPSKSVSMMPVTNTTVAPTLVDHPDKAKMQTDSGKKLPSEDKPGEKDPVKSSRETDADKAETPPNPDVPLNNLSPQSPKQDSSQGQPLKASSPNLVKPDQTSSRDIPKLQEKSVT